MPQRRTVLLGLAATALAPALSANRAFAAATADTPQQPDVLATGGGDLVIQPVNHATIVFSFGSEIIYLDPVGGAARYKPFNKPTAILVTHAHPDHFDVPTLEAIAATAKIIIGPKVVIDTLPPDLKAKAKLLANGDAGAVNGVPVKAIAAYNTTPDRLKYHPKGVGNGYVLSFGDREVYVAGDTEETPEMDALKAIMVAFLPMNLPYTMSGDAAAKAVEAFKPKLVYPYHYGKDGAEPAHFAAAMAGVAGIEIRQRDWYAYS